MIPAAGQGTTTIVMIVVAVADPRTRTTRNTRAAGSEIDGTEEGR